MTCTSDQDRSECRAVAHLTNSTHATPSGSSDRACGRTRAHHRSCDTSQQPCRRHIQGSRRTMSSPMTCTPPEDCSECRTVARLICATPPNPSGSSVRVYARTRAQPRKNETPYRCGHALRQTNSSTRTREAYRRTREARSPSATPTAPHTPPAEVTRRAPLARDPTCVRRPYFWIGAAPSPEQREDRRSTPHARRSSAHARVRAAEASARPRRSA